MAEHAVQDLLVLFSLLSIHSRTRHSLTKFRLFKLLLGQSGPECYLGTEWQKIGKEGKTRREDNIPWV